MDSFVLWITGQNIDPVTAAGMLILFFDIKSLRKEIKELKENLKTHEQTFHRRLKNA